MSSRVLAHVSPCAVEWVTVPTDGRKSSEHQLIDGRNLANQLGCTEPFGKFAKLPF